MNYEDRVTKSYLEGLIPRIVTGTYTGDGEATRFIDLGFTPKAVLVVERAGKINGDMNGLSVKSYFGGLALADSPVICGENFTLIDISEGGFTVRYHAAVSVGR